MGREEGGRKRGVKVAAKMASENQYGLGSGADYHMLDAVTERSVVGCREIG